MATYDFPTIQSPHQDLFSQHPVKAQHRTEMASARVLTRAMHVGIKWVFTMGWPAMSVADYNTLVTFFRDYGGALFNWTHFMTSVTYECVFLQDELPDAKPVSNTHWNLTDLQIGTPMSLVS